MKRLAFALLIVLIAAYTGLSAAQSDAPDVQEPDVQEIIDKADRLFRSDSSHGQMEMSIVTPDWERTLKMEMWTEGLEKTFVRVLSPSKDRGVATLRVDNEMWNYFPKINKVMKVPPSMMMGSWMGSDFTNDDLVKESSMLRDYTYRLIEPEGADPDHYYVELIPNEESAIVWGKIVIKVRKIDLIPVQEDFFDERGRKMRVMYLKDIREMGGKTFPTVMELIPLNKKDRKTVVRYTSIEFDKPIPGGTFSLRNLRKRI